MESGLYFDLRLNSTTYTLSIFVLEVQPNLFILNSAKFWAFFHFLNPSGYFFFARWGYFWGRGQARKHFWNLQMQTINFCFGSTSLSFGFSFGQILGPFLHFWAFRVYFWGQGQVQKIFETYLHRLTILFFGSIALSCFFLTFPSWWLRGWVDWFIRSWDERLENFPNKKN